jgi:hypothetical protein
MVIDGCIVMLDVDFMEEMVREKGLPEYKPNLATGFLTRAVESLAIKHSGVVVFGLDYERGTEEAVLEFPLTSCDELRKDLDQIHNELARMGFSISIVCLDGYVLGKKANTREEAYKGTPWRKKAYKELLRIKRKLHAFREENSPN